MKEFVIIGLTEDTEAIVGYLAESFAKLAASAVIADCRAMATYPESITSPPADNCPPRVAVIDLTRCVDCGICANNCPSGAITQDTMETRGPGSRIVQSDCLDCDHCERSCSIRTNVLLREMQETMGYSSRNAYRVDPILCEGCGHCSPLCSANAITMRTDVPGICRIGESALGPRIEVAFGSPVLRVEHIISLRRRAVRVAMKDHKHYSIVMCSPQTPVDAVSSMARATAGVLVTDSSEVGEARLMEALQGVRESGTPTVLCIRSGEHDSTRSILMKKKALLAGVIHGVSIDSGGLASSDSGSHQILHNEWETRWQNELLSLWNQLTVMEE